MLVVVGSDARSRATAFGRVWTHRTGVVAPGGVGGETTDPCKACPCGGASSTGGVGEGVPNVGKGEGEGESFGPLWQDLAEVGRFARTVVVVVVVVVVVLALAGSDWSGLVHFGQSLVAVVVVVVMVVWG